MPTDPNCIFCKIIAGQIPSKKVYEDDDVFAFHDIHPWAPVHFLMVPKRHVPSMAQVDAGHEALLGRMMALAPKLALEQGCGPYPQGGFRIVVNTGDEGGQEILAILEEVLEAGYVHLDAGTPSELYVWPYFFAVPLERLTPAQRVELFKIVTAGDYDDMKSYGAYIFYRVGINPEGRWQFFVAGD